MTPFSTPQDRAEVHLSDTPAHAEAAARILTAAAKRIREGQSVRDVCSGLVDIVLALSGRI